MLASHHHSGVLHGDQASGRRGWRRLDGVDVLRGIAIFFVIMNHVNMRLFLADIPYAEGLPAQWVSSLFWNGQYGVQIFFAVSGFLITYTSIRRWGALSNVSIRDFYALRFARIAPLLLLLLAVLVVLHGAALKDYTVPAATGGLGRALVAALTFHVNLLEADRGYLPGSWDVLWSLSVEEMFYLFFPLICRLAGRGPWLIGVLATFVVLGPFGRTVLAHGNEVWEEYSYLGGMDAIALGSLTAIAIGRAAISPAAGHALGALGAALMIFILGFSKQAAVAGLARSGLDMTALGVGTCMLMAAAAEAQWAAPRLLSPLMRLGQRSYEIYLTHMFAVFALFGLFNASSRPPGAIPVLFIAVLLASSVMGKVVARSYSEPMNRFLRRRFGDGADTLGSVIPAEGVT